MTEKYSYPDSLKKLRACTICHLVKTEDQVRVNLIISSFPMDVKIVGKNTKKQRLSNILHRISKGSLP